jgi:hypothetical protein
MSGYVSVLCARHMEIGGVEIPLGKGMSFYQLDAHGASLSA